MSQETGAKHFRSQTDRAMDESISVSGKVNRRAKSSGAFNKQMMSFFQFILLTLPIRYVSKRKVSGLDQPLLSQYTRTI